jgi:hypothetical protein
MIAAGCQRWRKGRDSYRPAGEVIDPADYEVRPLDTVADARAFVELHHYSHAWVADRFRYGMFHRRDGELVGVAVFSTPAHPNVIGNWFPSLPDWRLGVELGRFVLLDKVPGNGETWFLARCREYLRAAGITGIVLFADPVPRTRADGSTVFVGHVGTIYQASNAVLAGRGRGQTLRLFGDGTNFHRRNRGKILGLHAGWRGAVSELTRRGAFAWGDLEAGTRAERAAWLESAIAATTRPLRHPGNLRYLWGLSRRTRRQLPPTDRYPKAPDSQQLSLVA